MGLFRTVFAHYPTRLVSRYVVAGTGQPVADESIGAIYQEHAGTGNNHSGFFRAEAVLPTDFVSFLEVGGWTRRVGALDSFTVSLEHGTSIDTAVNASSVLPGAADTWEPWSRVPADTYAAGERVLLEFADIADNGEKAHQRGVYFKILTRGGRRRIALVEESNVNWVTGSGAAGTLSNNYDSTLASQWRFHLGTGANQVGSSYLYWRLDPSFNGWGQGISFESLKTGSTDSATVSMWRNGSLVVNAQNVLPSSADAWESFTVAPGAGWAPMDEVLLKWATQVDNAGELRLRRLKILWTA